MSTASGTRSEWIDGLAALRAVLDRDGIPHRVDEERLIAPVRKDGLESEIAILWPESHTLVQFIVPLPIALPRRSVPEVALAVAMVNHALVLPGFGLNVEQPLLYYRAVVPRDAGGRLPLDAVQRAATTAIQTAASFYEAFAALARGELEAERILAWVEGGRDG